MASRWKQNTYIPATITYSYQTVISRRNEQPCCTTFKFPQTHPKHKWTLYYYNVTFSEVHFSTNTLCSMFVTLSDSIITPSGCGGHCALTPGLIVVSFGVDSECGSGGTDIKCRWWIRECERKCCDCWYGNLWLQAPISVLVMTGRQTAVSEHHHLRRASTSAENWVIGGDSLISLSHFSVMTVCNTYNNSCLLVPSILWDRIFGHLVCNILIISHI